MDAIDEKVIGCLVRDAPGDARRDRRRGRAVRAGGQAPDRPAGGQRRRSAGSPRVIDPDVLGWQTEAYVELYCKGTVAPEELRRSLEQVPEVVGACTVSGDADALVHMLASDVKQLERALERIRDEPNVDHTRSVIVLSRLIDRPARRVARSGGGAD